MTWVRTSAVSEDVYTAWDERGSHGVCVPLDGDVRLDQWGTEWDDFMLCGQIWSKATPFKMFYKEQDVID